MSAFGFVSIFIAVLSIAAIVLHYRVMRKRSPVDNALAQLEDLLRQRVEAILDTSDEDTELFALCSQVVDMDYAALFGAVPDIENALWETIEAGEHVPMDVLSENAHAIQAGTEALNQAIVEYNHIITAKPSGVLMALILGLAVEEPVDPPWLNAAGYVDAPSEEIPLTATEGEDIPAQAQDDKEDI